MCQIPIYQVHRLRSMTIYSIINFQYKAQSQEESMACLRDNPTPEKSTVLLAFLIFLSLLSSCKHQERQTSETTQSPTPESNGLRASTSKRTVFKTGEAVPVSYLGYKVYDSWFVNDGTGTSEGSTQKHQMQDRLDN